MKPSCIRAEVLFNKGECQIHTGRHTSTCIDVSVRDEYRFCVHHHLGILACKLLAEIPVRRDAAAVQKTRLCEDESFIPLLTYPAAHGGNAADAFDVVIPSLPGFGFSDRPAIRGMNAFRVADLWAGLMSEFGYTRFAAQGGDLGAGVSTVLGLRYAHRIIGLHLNFIPGSYRPCLEERPKLAPVEEEFTSSIGRWAEESGAYSHMQRTRPQTAAFGLNDSPAGLAAWILEKFREWSDWDSNFYQRFSQDELLTNVTLYWMTETIHSSFRMYFENRNAPLQFGPGDFVQVPCGIAHFPKEIMFPPREWIERGYHVQHWTEMPRGGHFPAMEQPELFAEDVRAFFRRFRS